MAKTEAEQIALLAQRLLNAGRPPDGLDPGQFDYPRNLIAQALLDGHPPDEIRRMIGGDLLDAMLAIDPTAPPEAAQDAILAKRWRVLGIGDLLQPPKPPKYLIDGMIRSPGLVSVYGVPGDLKTMICLDMAVAVASGQPWLAPLPGIGTGGDYGVQQGPVLILDQDNGADRLKERFGALLRARNALDAPVHAICLPRPIFDASKPEDADLLASQIARLGAVLCIVDNLGTVSGGRDENSSQMVDVMANLRWIADQTESVLGIIHHARKGNGAGAGGREGDRLRGHSSIEASLDLALIVERSDDDLTIRSTKTRDNPVKPFVARWTYDLDDHGALLCARFWHICTTGPKTPEYVKIAGGLPDLLKARLDAPNQTQLVKMIGDTHGASKNTAIEAIRNAVARGLIKETRQGTSPTAPVLYQVAQ